MLFVRWNAETRTAMHNKYIVEALSSILVSDQFPACTTLTVLARLANCYSFWLKWRRHAALALTRVHLTLLALALTRVHLTLLAWTVDASAVSHSACLPVVHINPDKSRVYNPLAADSVTFGFLRNSTLQCSRAKTEIMNAYDSTDMSSPMSISVSNHLA
jgi:hypothetical protein